jgi:hypothetical protein
MLAVLFSFIGIKPLALNLEDVVRGIDSGVQDTDECDPFLCQQPWAQFPQLVLVVPLEQFL